MDRGENLLQQRIVFRARNLSEDDRQKLFEFLEVQNVNEIDSELTEYEAFVNPVKIMTALQAKKNTVLDEISLFSGKTDVAFEQGRKMLNERFLANKPRSESFLEDVKPEVDKAALATRAGKLVADLKVEMLHQINNERRQNEIFVRRHKLLVMSGATGGAEKRRDLDRVISERDKAQESVTRVRDKINEYRIKFKALKEHRDEEDRKYRELHQREVMLLKELDEGEKKTEPLKEYFKSLFTCSE